MSKWPGPRRARREDAPPWLPKQPQHMGRSPVLFSPYNVQRNGKRPWPGLPHPTRCALRFSQPLDALLLPVPLRACSIPMPFLGLMPFRDFPSREAEHLSVGHAPPGVGTEIPAYRGLSHP
jgi:hypothetical protein